VCVCVYLCVVNHAGVQPWSERAPLADASHRPGGVPVFRRGHVRLGLVGVRLEVRGILQLDVCQRHRGERHAGPR